MYKSLVLISILACVYGEVPRYTEELIPPLCPPVEAIHPCTCTSDGQYGGPALDCSSATTNADIELALSAEFPDNLHLFKIANNAMTVLDAYAPNDLAVKEVIILGSNIEEISADFFAQFPLLEKIFIGPSKISQESFPFEIFDTPNQIVTLYFHNLKEFTELPMIAAGNLTVLYLEDLPLSEIKAGTLSQMPNLFEVFMSKAHLGSIQPLTFHISGISTIHLTECQITDVQPEAFYYRTVEEAAAARSLTLVLTKNPITQLVAGSIPISPAMNTIGLDDCQIESVAPGAFVLPTDTSTCFMGHMGFINNKLATISEEAFGPLFKSCARLINSLHFDMNPLECNCDLAWLVRNGTLKSFLSEKTACTDGTPVKQLPLDHFSEC